MEPLGQQVLAIWSDDSLGQEKAPERPALCCALHHSIPRLGEGVELKPLHLPRIDVVAERFQTILVHLNAQ